MKVLVITPSTMRGGVEEYALRITAAAVRAGWEAHVAFPKVDGVMALIQDFRHNGVSYHRLDISETLNGRWLTVRKYLPHCLRTLKLLQQLRPDVVQIVLPNPAHCYGSILACGYLQVPTVVRFGLVPFRWTFEPKKLQAYAWARHRNQQWLAISKQNLNLISESFDIPKTEIRCIYNGSKVAPEFDSGGSAAIRTDVRHELAIADTSQLLLTVGRLSNQKGYVNLIPAIPHILKEFPKVQFVWVGDGEKRAELSAMLEAYGVADSVRLLGYRSDVPRLLQAADLFVFPTLYEGGQSSAIAEAMAYGTPIVTSDASGIPEVIEHKVHGVTFRAGDSCDLLETLRWALRNPDAMREMAQNAKARTKTFSEERMFNETLALWEKMAQSSLL